jgi:hypothetical protein
MDDIRKIIASMSKEEGEEFMAFILQYPTEDEPEYSEITDKMSAMTLEQWIPTAQTLTKDTESLIRITWEVALSKNTALQENIDKLEKTVMANDTKLSKYGKKLDTSITTILILIMIIMMIAILIFHYHYIDV